jgi:hypothetical protein
MIKDVLIMNRPSQQRCSHGVKYSILEDAPSGMSRNLMANQDKVLLSERQSASDISPNMLESRPPTRHRFFSNDDREDLAMAQ